VDVARYTNPALQLAVADLVRTSPEQLARESDLRAQVLLARRVTAAAGGEQGFGDDLAHCSVTDAAPITAGSGQGAEVGR
jgi:hypothetical protein